jgi:HEAT repeat protein
LIDGLGKALGDPDRGVARAASDSLAEIGRKCREVDEVLRRALYDDDPRRRWGAAFTWARLEPPGARLLPALVEALDAHEGAVRWTAARLLVESGRAEGQVLPLLLGLVRTDDRPRVRRMASHCLRELAPERPEAAAALLESSRDRDSRVRRASLTALAGLLEPPPEVEARLREAAENDPDAASRQVASRALDRLGPQKSKASSE